MFTTTTSEEGASNPNEREGIQPKRVPSVLPKGPNESRSLKQAKVLVYLDRDKEVLAERKVELVVHLTYLLEV